MPGSLGIYLSVCGLQLRALGLLTLSSTPRPGSVLASTMGIRGGDGGKALTVQPPAGYLASRPGRHAGHRATRSLLVIPGQGSSPLRPLDSDALDAGIRTRNIARRPCGPHR